MKKYWLCIILLWFVYPAVAVLAKTQESKIITPLLYSIAQQQTYVDEAMGASGAASFSPQQLLDIIIKAQSAGTLASIGTVVADGKGYKASTGISGTAVGQMPGGTYTVEVMPVEGVTMLLAARTITIDPATPGVLDIAMKLTKGAGRVTYRSEALTWNRLKQLAVRVWTASVGRIFEKSPKKQATGEVPSNAVIVIRLYQDANNNGLYDEKEKVVPWANATILFTPTSK